MKLVAHVVRRTLTRNRSRALLTAALTFALTAIVTAGFVFLNALTPSTEQIHDSTLRGADVGFSYGSLPDDGVAAVRLESLRALLTERYGSDTRISEGLQAVGIDVGVKGGTAIAANLWELDSDKLDLASADRLVTGAFPNRACDGAVSQDLASRLGVGVGDVISVALSDQLIRVTGVYEPRLSHSGQSLLVAPGTWERCISEAPGGASATAFLTAWVSIPPTSSRTFESDFTPRPSDGVLPVAEYIDPDVAITAVSTTDDGWDPFWVQRPIAFTLPVLSLMAIAVTAQIAIRMRRETHLMGSLQALGFQNARVVSIVLLSSLLPIAAGAAAGFAVGLGVAVALQGVAAAFAGRDVTTNPLPVDAIISGVMVFMVVCTIGLGLSAWGFARKGDLARSSVHFVERMPPPRASRAFTVAFYILLAAAVGCWLLLPPDDVFGLIRGALVCAALIASVPLMIQWLAVRADPRCPIRWLGARVARSQPGRMATIAAAVAVGLATPLAMQMLQSTYAADAELAYQPSIPAGQVVVLLQSPLDSGSIQRLTDAAGVDPVVQSRVVSSSGGDVFAAPAGVDEAQAQITVVDNPDEAAVTLGWSMPDDAWEAINAGDALWINDASQPRNIQLVAYDNAGAPEILGEIPAVSLTQSEMVPSTATHDGGVIITSETASRLQLDLEPFWLRFPDAAPRSEEIVSAAAGVGIASSDVRVDTGPEASSPPLSYSVALVMALVLVGCVVFIVIISSGKEDRRTTGVLISLGADRDLVRNLYLYLSALALVVGVLVGLISAFAVFTAEYVYVGYSTISVPWLEVLVTLGAVLLVGAAAAITGALTQAPARSTQS